MSVESIMRASIAWRTTDLQFYGRHTVSAKNLLFIYTDEHAVSGLGAYGNDMIETPNTDRLAAQSVVFDNAYVSQPVCTPSRSTIVTGLYPHGSGCTENNIPLPAEVPCLPELADFSGYRTAHYGKWHLGDEIFAQHGFDEWVSIEDGYRKYYSPDRDHNAHSDYHHYLVEQGFEPEEGPDGFESFSRGYCARLPEEHGKPAFLARESSRFLRECGDRPFMLYVNFLEPHMPFFGPRDDQYDPAQIPLPANFDHPPGPEQPLKLRAFRDRYKQNGHSGLPLQTREHWQRLIANYWGLCSLVDTYVGQILNTLAECGLEDDTIVVYTSDHGDMMGSHQLLAKCTQYQEAVQVPLMVRVPGMQPGRVSCPVSQVDLVPTLLELLGRPVPSGLHGQSWKPWFGGDTPCPQRDVVVHWNGHNSGVGGDVLGRVELPDGGLASYSPEALAASITDPVRTIITADGWKFNCSPLGEHELYHLADDPGETRNLYRQPEHRALVRQLHERLVEHGRQVEDTVDLRQVELA